MNNSELDNFDSTTLPSPSHDVKDVYWLLKSIFALVAVISVILVAEYVACHFTRDSALDQLHEEGMVTEAELTGQTFTFRTGRRGGSTTFKYSFKVDGDTKDFESSRTPPNTDIFSNKRSTFSVTYLPDDYTVHVFGDVKTGHVDEESVQYHGKKIVMIFWFAKVIALFFGSISLIIVLFGWISSFMRGSSTQTPSTY